VFVFEEETLLKKKTKTKKNIKKYMKICQWNLVVLGFRAPFVREKTRHAPSEVRSTPVQSQQGMLPKAMWDWQSLQTTPLSPTPLPSHPKTLSLLPKG
jgi:hypothetical protein